MNVPLILVRLVVGSALLTTLGSCSTLRGQFVAQNVSGCVKNSCSESEANAYRQCEAACRNRYGQ